MSNRPGDEHQREEARDDEVLDRVDAEHLQRVELLADLARAEVGGDRRAGHAGEHDRVTNGANSRIEASTKKPPRRSSAPNRTRKFAACRPGRAVAERDRRDQQREPAQPQREQELADELAAVRVRRTQGRHDRLPRQDHHVADFLEQVLRRKKRSIGDAANHRPTSSSGTLEAAHPTARRRGGTLRAATRDALPNRQPSRPANRRVRAADACGSVPRAVRGTADGAARRAGAHRVVALVVAGCGGGERQDAERAVGHLPGRRRHARRSRPQRLAEHERARDRGAQHRHAGRSRTSR